jgi:hypothetical protein
MEGCFGLAQGLGGSGSPDHWITSSVPAFRPPHQFTNSPILQFSSLGVARTQGKGQSDFSDWPLFNAGNYLLSHTLSRAVQSAQRGLTSVFGMGTGGSPAV